MKKIVFFLFFNVLVGSVFSQMDSIHMTYYLANTLYPYTNRTSSIVTANDTIIDGYSCHKIATEHGGIMPYITYVSNGDSVLYYNTEKGKFELLYDFTKEVGDTIYYKDFPESLLGMHIDSFAIVVTKTGYIKDESMTDSLKYIRFSYAEPFHSMATWGNIHIQYLGSDIGFFPQHGLVCSGKSLGCATINGEKTYVLYPSICASSNEELDSRYASVSVYPNPVQDQLHIDLSETDATGKLHVEVLTLQGKTLHRQSISSSGLNTVNVKGLPSGVYVVVLKNEKEQVVMQKKILK